MLDELRAWGLSPPALVADAGYGEVTAFRAALEERELAYVVEVKAATSAYEKDVLPERPAWRGCGRPSAARYRRPPAALRGLALAAGSAAASEVTWREGSRGPMSARFLALRVRPANVGLRRAHREALPLAWLLCQWPEGAAEPEKYWLANLPAEATTLAELVRLAKLRWRIELDYRELKDALGLDHFEGRSFRGWHHHVTLVSLAHGFLTLQRLDPKADAPA